MAIHAFGWSQIRPIFQLFPKEKSGWTADFQAVRPFNVSFYFLQTFINYSGGSGQWSFFHDMETDEEWNRSSTLWTYRQRIHPLLHLQVGGGWRHQASVEYQGNGYQISGGAELKNDQWRMGSWLHFPFSSGKNASMHWNGYAAWDVSDNFSIAGQVDFDLLRGTVADINFSYGFHPDWSMQLGVREPFQMYTQLAYRFGEIHAVRFGSGYHVLLGPSPMAGYHFAQGAKP